MHWLNSWGAAKCWEKLRSAEGLAWSDSFVSWPDLRFHCRDCFISSSHQDDLVQVHWWWAFGHDHGQHRHQQRNCYVCQWLSEHTWQGLGDMHSQLFFTQPYPPNVKQVAKIHSQWLGTLASAVHLATESHCCGISPYGVRFMLPVCICWSLSGWRGDNIW